MRRKLTDRRDKARFDIVGDLWGALETVLRLPLRNVSPHGALVESAVPLPTESIHRLAFDCGGREVDTEVTVRHVRAVVSPRGDRAYWVGVEFKALHPALLEQINRWVAANTGEAAAMDV